ncbi:MAG: hypothetical protein JXA18_06355 [Chitinispirillaceae bacterium]|nr:hypothetical protein [Chitinispirillaceae bacterium]
MSGISAVGTVGAVVAIICLYALVITGKRFSKGVADYGGLLTPWQCVGGCGAGGSGGGSSGIKWIGEGAAGGRVHIEMLPKLNFGREFVYMTAVPRVAFNPVYTTELGISMLVGFKEARVQYQTNMPQQTELNGGKGDLTLDVMHSFGSEGQFIWQTALTFPTGEWDAAHGTDVSKNILPQKMQMGQGVYSATLGLFYSFDVENGMYVFDGFLNYPFMFRFDKKNRYLETDYKAYKNVTENRERFYYKHILKHYGESDRGDYYPPSISLDAIYAYRGVPRLTQSFQLFFLAPLGVRWIHSHVPTEYNPMPDPDHRAWEAVLSYGVEFSRERFPLFFGVGLPIHDRKDPVGKWDAPEWKNIGNEWIAAFGFKAAMF